MYVYTSLVVVAPFETQETLEVTSKVSGSSVPPEVTISFDPSRLTLDKVTVLSKRLSIKTGVSERTQSPLSNEILYSVSKSRVSILRVHEESLSNLTTSIPSSA